MAKIDIYTQDTHVSYSACGLPYYVQGNFEDYKNLIIRTPEKFQKDGIDIHLLHRVEKIYPDENRIKVRDIQKDVEFFVDYDKIQDSTSKRNLSHVLMAENIVITHIFFGDTIVKIDNALSSSINDAFFSSFSSFLK